MKNEKKNIDQLISNKLKGYEPTPPLDVWDGIAQGLSGGSKKAFLPAFLKIAAGIAILLSVGLSYMMINRSGTQMEDKNTAETSYSEPSLPETKETEYSNTETLKNVPEQKYLPEKQVLKTNEFDRSQLPDKRISIENRKYIAKDHIESDHSEPEPVIIYPKLSAEDLVYQKELIHPDDKIKIAANKPVIASWDMLHENTDHEKVRDVEKYSLSASMSPLYTFRDIVGNNAENFNNAETGKISYSGGLQFGIRQGKRLSFQTGMFYSRIGLGVDHIYAYNSFSDYEQPGLFNNTYIASNSIGQIAGDEQKEIVYSSNKTEPDMLSVSTGFQNEAAISTDASLDQYFHVLEVPFLARYTIIDRSVNVNVLSGLSTNFIVGNEVFLDENGTESYFGKTGSINSVNYSGNLGLGFDYQMNKTFLFSVEPIFKYYLNSINTGNLINARPYNFGLYTGIRYIF